MRRRARPGPFRAAVVAVAVVGGLGPPLAGAQVTGLDPRVAGQWTVPSEEGGAGQPRCIAAADGYDCKPTAAWSVLPDGRVLYFNGIEGQENADGPLASQDAVRAGTASPGFSTCAAVPPSSPPPHPTPEPEGTRTSSRGTARSTTRWGWRGSPAAPATGRSGAPGE